MPFYKTFRAAAKHCSSYTGIYCSLIRAANLLFKLIAELCPMNPINTNDTKKVKLCMNNTKRRYKDEEINHKEKGRNPLCMHRNQLLMERKCTRHPCALAKTTIPILKKIWLTIN